MSESIGEIHDKDSLLMRVHVGTAKSGDDSYEMSHGMGYTPVVRSLTTGKFFTLCWQDIINLAVEAGINEGDSEKE